MTRLMLTIALALFVGCSGATAPDTTAEDGVSKMIVYVSCESTVKFNSGEPIAVKAGGFATWTRTMNPRSTWSDQKVTVSIAVGGVSKYTFTHMVPWGTVEELRYECK